MNPNSLDIALAAVVLALLVHLIRTGRRARTAERRLARSQALNADLNTAAADLRDQLDEHELAIAAARTEAAKREQRHLRLVRAS